MDILDILAEQKIEQANAEGKLDNLPGKGKPLNLVEDPHVPREMRAMNRLLKQAGILPGWAQQEKDTRALDEEIQKVEQALYHAHAKFAEELILIPSPALLSRARQFHAQSRAKFVELLNRRGHLFRSYDANAPRGASRAGARPLDEDLRRFDKLFPPFE